MSVQSSTPMVNPLPCWTWYWYLVMEETPGFSHSMATPPLRTRKSTTVMGEPVQPYSVRYQPMWDTDDWPSRRGAGTTVTLTVSRRAGVGTVVGHQGEGHAEPLRHQRGPEGGPPGGIVAEFHRGSGDLGPPVGEPPVAQVDSALPRRVTSAPRAPPGSRRRWRWPWGRAGPAWRG